jgi:hypothetical protein
MKKLHPAEKAWRQARRQGITAALLEGLNLCEQAWLKARHLGIAAADRAFNQELERGIAVGMQHWRETVDQGLADYHRAVAESEARGVSHTDFLRAYIDAHEGVFAVIPATPLVLEEYLAIKIKEELKGRKAGSRPLIKWSFIPVADREEAASLSRSFGNVWNLQ